jgi:hypothetical protein
MLQKYIAVLLLFLLFSKCIFKHKCQYSRFLMIVPIYAKVSNNLFLNKGEQGAPLFPPKQIW